ncbi:HAMP domain-containing sensor histidine kinase [Pedobacter arcticus]|uniref:HAMP domain-containing sensor histidine kinase n=1 Tax=Pedobacter arcticus TaxID=752140 RepID=UPI00031621F7|nr:sensor histidine kinase [Pedobacter arcticus]
MKIKTKLLLGFGFLFVVVLFFGAVSLYNINAIAISSKEILKDNYESLNYTRKLRSILDNNALPLSQNQAAKFNSQLILEEQNITETGEDKATSTIRKHFSTLINTTISAKESQHIRSIIYSELGKIDEVNMRAIVKKNEIAQQGVKTASTYVMVTATICFLVLFTFSVNFPGFVANPLGEFSDAIKEIGKKNYKQRLHFNGTDEFAVLATEFNTMVEQLNKWEGSNIAKLQSEKLRIEAIIEQMRDAIIGLNEKNEVLFFNKVAGELLNLNKTNVIGADAKELMMKNDLLYSILHNTNLDKAIKIYADGKESYFQLEKREILVPLTEEQVEKPMLLSRKPAGEVYILKNITQYKELDEAKTHFIATVSHELKTPISSIKMSLILMDDERVGQMNTEQKQLVQHIKEDCNRLLKITSELLDLAQVETGNLQLHFAHTDPITLANYAIDSVRLQAEQQAITLELITSENLPKINVDTEKTAWVLVNFLSNALRYSPQKSKIIIEIASKDKYVEFSVKDSGKGIEEQYQKRLFDKYFQVPTDGNNKSGSGLGLAISKDFIVAENGTIWVESALGEGSRFCFSLPVVS